MIRIVFVLITLVFSSLLIAEERYRGSVSGRIVEPNNHIFTFGGGGESFSGQQKFYYRQYSGQKAKWNDKQLVVDGSQENKYSVRFNVLERTGDAFKAEFKVYQNRLVKSEKARAIVESTLLHQEIVEGHLNVRNEYKILSDDKPNYYFTIHLDRHFSLEEIKARHLGDNAPQ